MHYANGREAKVGDRIVGVDVSGDPMTGTVVKTYPETDRCNLIIVPANAPTYTITAGDCLHVDDFREWTRRDNKTNGRQA